MLSETVFITMSTYYGFHYYVHLFVFPLCLKYLNLLSSYVMKQRFLTKEKETRVKRWSALEQLRPVEHLLRQ